MSKLRYRLRLWRWFLLNISEDHQWWKYDLIIGSLNFQWGRTATAPPWVPRLSIWFYKLGKSTDKTTLFGKVTPPGESDAEKLQAHIRKENADARAQMAKRPGLWIGMMTDDLEHWQDYGVYTVEQYKQYLDDCVEREREKGNIIE